MSCEQIVVETAKQIIKKMKEKDKKEILKYKPIMLHFSFGLWIRNNYIYGHKEFDKYEPDWISQDIIEEIQKQLKKEKKIK